MDEESNISVYSQTISFKRYDDPGCERYSFPDRAAAIINTIHRLKPDVIAFNRVQHGLEASLMEKELQNAGYDVKEFSNEEAEISASNILGVRKKCEWEVENWEQAWMAMSEKDCPLLKTGPFRSEHNSFGRCVGIAYLRHGLTGKQVCVATTHTTAFGLLKHLQQKAFLSLNLRNNNRHKEKFIPRKSCPTILVGGLNRFHRERTLFRANLLHFLVREVFPSRLAVYWTEGGRGEGSEDDFLVLENKQNIGTFSPCPSDDEIHEHLLSKPMYVSRPDTQVYTDDPTSINLTNCEVHPSMMGPPEKGEHPHERDKIRHMLHAKMASDHLAIFSIFSIRHSSFGI